MRATPARRLKLACGDHVTALVLRHLEPLSEADKHSLRDFAGRAHQRAMVAAAQGPGHRAPAGPRRGPQLAYRLPEFGITMPFKPTDFTQVNPHINRVLVTPGAAPAGCAKARARD